jgi:hypothetical protein
MEETAGLAQALPFADGNLRRFDDGLRGQAKPETEVGRKRAAKSRKETQNGISDCCGFFVPFCDFLRPSSDQPVDRWFRNALLAVICYAITGIAALGRLTVFQLGDRNRICSA